MSPRAFVTSRGTTGVSFGCLGTLALGFLYVLGAVLVAALVVALIGLWLLVLLGAAADWGSIASWWPPGGGPDEPLAVRSSRSCGSRPGLSGQNGERGAQCPDTGADHKRRTTSWTSTYLSGDAIG